MNIHIGNSKVPLIDYAVGAAAVLGIRDSGKTVTTKGIVEQLLDHKIPVVVFDAVGKWRWLKTAAAGGRAYNVVVAGGRVPDLPLNPESVKEIVRSAVKERIPLVIDLFDKNLSKADWKRIVKTAIHIIHYENEGGPIHIVLEEAAEFVPQRIMEQDVYGEIEKVVRMGGNAGVGITLINQRSQEVNKAVLEQCTTLILGQQIGNKAIEAVGKWVERLDATIADEVLTTLPKLKAGQAWVWTRQNPDHPTKEQMPMCRSHHPDRREASEVKVEGLKSSDPTEFVQRLSASIPKVIEQAKANDPAELRKQIYGLQQDLKRTQNELQNTRAEAAHVETKVVPVLTKEDLEQWKAVHEVAAKTIERVGNALMEKFQSNPDYKPALFKRGTQFAALPARKYVEPIIHKRTNPVTHLNGQLGKAEREILNVVATFGSATKKKCAVMAGYAMRGGGFNNAVSRLRASGLVMGSDPLEITAEGAAVAQPKPLPTGKELLDVWMAHPQLGRAEREILRVLWYNGQRMAKESIADLTMSDRGEPYEAEGGGFNNAISRLRSLELIEGKGEFILSKDFYG
jgi:hypothetical protein